MTYQSLNKIIFAVAVIVFAALPFLSVQAFSVPYNAGPYTDITQQSVKGAANSNGANADVKWSAMSGDGRYITFISEAGNLVSNDHQGTDFFLRDIKKDKTTLISVDNSGNPATNTSLSPIGANYYGPDISEKGNVIAFASDAPNLPNANPTGITDIFVRNLNGQNATTKKISGNISGNFGAYRPVMSPNGKYVAYATSEGISSNDTNNAADVYLYNRYSNSNNNILVTTTYSQLMNGRSLPLSATNKYMLYASTATNAADGVKDDAWDLFRYNFDTGTSSLVSVDNNGKDGSWNIGQNWADMSSDGRYVVFSSGDELAPLDDNSVEGMGKSNYDVFLRDMQKKKTMNISIDSGGTSDNEWSGMPHISSNGRFVVFLSMATNLDSNDTTDDLDVYIRDRDKNTTQLISSPKDINLSSGGVDISRDGGYVTFLSKATFSQTDDTDSHTDLFLLRKSEVSYIGSFTEDAANDGTINGQRTATLENDTFVNAGGTLTEGTHYTVSNEPAGVTPQMSVSGNGKTAILTFNGKANDHASSDSVTNLTISFKAAGLTNTTDTDEIANSTNTTGKITFDDPSGNNGGGGGTSGGTTGGGIPSITQNNFSSGGTNGGGDDTPDSGPDGSSTENQAAMAQFSQAGTLLGSGACPEVLQVEDNMIIGDRDGEYGEYNDGVVSDVALLQLHINRILASEYDRAAGPVDGIFGPLTKRGVERLQRTLRDEIGADLGSAGVDGIVGPMTRQAINNSCPVQAGQ